MDFKNLPNSSFHSSWLYAADVLLSQQAYLGNISLDLIQKLRADVAPIVNGAPQPNGELGMPDIMVIQRKAMNLVNF